MALWCGCVHGGGWWVIYFYFFCKYSVLCVRVGWVGAGALDKEKKGGKNKEKDKSEARK